MMIMHTVYGERLAEEVDKIDRLSRAHAENMPYVRL